MTTIAFKDSIIACDSAVSVDEQITTSIKKKYFKKGVWTYGVAGDLSAFSILMGRLNDLGTFGHLSKAKPLDKLTYQVIAISDNGVISHYHSTSKFEGTEEKYYAIGSGGQLAYDAMKNGASAVDAVRYAACEDDFTGLSIIWLDIKTGETGVAE